MMDMLDLKVGPLLCHHVAKGETGIEERELHKVAKHGLQVSQTFDGGLRARELFGVQRKRAVRVHYGDQAVIEGSGFDGSPRAMLACGRKCIKFGPTEAFLCGNDICGDADVGLWVGVAKVQVARIQRCLLYTSPSPRDKRQSRMPSSA